MNPEDIVAASDDALAAEIQALGIQVDQINAQRTLLANELRSRAEQRGGFLSNTPAVQE